jgi:hypothetical protein
VERACAAIVAASAYTLPMDSLGAISTGERDERPALRRHVLALFLGAGIPYLLMISSGWTYRGEWANSTAHLSILQ